MLLKICGRDDVAPFGDDRKTFILLEGVEGVEFIRHEERPDINGVPHSASAVVFFRGSEDPETYPVPGNAYCMNDNGKTLESFARALVV